MIRFPILWLIVAAASTIPIAAQAQGNTPLSNEQKAGRLTDLFRRSSSTGGAYLVRYRRGDQVVSKAFGSLDCAGKEPMSAEALFDSGSLTKLFTAAAIHKLVEGGRLKLDDELGEIFRGVSADKRAITVSQLLSHRSGIANLVGSNGLIIPQSEWTPETYDYARVSKAELLKRAWRAPLGFRPGSGEAYSNTGYSILAAIVEQASGRPYEAYVRDRVFRPLGMTSTAYVPAQATTLPIVQQCRRGGAAWGDPITRGYYKSGVSWNLMGNGGMMTNLEDLDRWSAGLEAAKLFRADIHERFASTLYGPSYRCRTQLAAVGGSNGMTRSLILHMPRKRELLISVGTRADQRLPQEEEMLTILCPA